MIGTERLSAARLTPILARGWEGTDLSGDWLFTHKLDGIRALVDDHGRAISKEGTPFYHLSHLPAGDYEIFCGSIEATTTAIRTHLGPDVSPEQAYALDPPDPRLILGTLRDPNAATIRHGLAAAQARGDEGIVLRQGTCWLKVKPIATYDVPVIGLKAGARPPCGPNGRHPDPARRGRDRVFRCRTRSGLAHRIHRGSRGHGVDAQGPIPPCPVHPTPA